MWLSWRRLEDTASWHGQARVHYYKTNEGRLHCSGNSTDTQGHHNRKDAAILSAPFDT